MIEVRDLTKSYGDVLALAGVSFDVQRGEIIGLLGPNGAGKSTAMRIITGYLAPSSGSVKVAGNEVMDDPVAAQKHIGYLPEGNPLYLELRLREALRFAAEMHGLRGAERDRAIAGAVQSTGLRGMEHRKIITFSRGYRQRVGLAQALLHEPPVLILDEPSSGLDPNQQEDMRKFIRGLGERCAVIFSTHILPEVDAICDRALIVDRGRLVGQGTTAEIVSQAQVPGHLSVSVEGSADAARDALGALPVVSGVEVQESEDASVRVRAKVSGVVDDDVLRSAAGALRDRGVNYWGLRAEDVSLAEAFAALTSTDGQASAGPANGQAAQPEQDQEEGRGTGDGQEEGGAS